MAAVIPVAALLPIQDPPPRFIRICLRHHLPLTEVTTARAYGQHGVTEILRCAGPASRPRTCPGQPPGTHRATAWGVLDVRKDRVVAIGTELRIILLDDFDYPKALAEAFGLQEVDAEIGPDSPAVQMAAAVNRSQASGVRLTRQMVSTLKEEIAVPGWRVKDILVRYDISQTTLWMIRVGQMWRSVPGPEAVPPVGSKKLAEKRLTVRGRDC